MDEEEFGKAVVTKEPSRWQAGGIGHFPTWGTQKMRRMAANGLGEAGALVREATRMMRTQNERGAYDGNLPVKRVVLTLQDVTHGLGLDFSDEQRIQLAVSDTLPTFTQKTQTQRIMHARGRFMSVLRDSMKHVDSDTRMELVRRAVAYWKRNYQLDYGKAPTVRHRGYEARKSMRFIIPVAAPALGHVIPIDTLLKAGPFIGPRGGRYADAAHKIPWKESERPAKGGHFSTGAAALRQAKSAKAAKNMQLINELSNKVLQQYAHGPSVDDTTKLRTAWKKLNPGGTNADFASAVDSARGVKVKQKIIEDTPIKNLEEYGRGTLSASREAEIKKELSRRSRADAKRLARKALIIPISTLLHKAVRGGKYYRRVPNPGYTQGGKKSKYRYYYTREKYEAEHGAEGAHIEGERAKRLKAIAKLKKELANRTTVKNALNEDIPVKDAKRLWVKSTDFGLPAQTIFKHAKDTGRRTKYGEAIREYTKERQELHDNLVAKAVKGVPRVPDSQQPVAIVMMGGGGAGKGTLIKAVVHDRHDFVHVDPDDLKGELPEYKQAMEFTSIGGAKVTAKDAAWMAHEESGDISDQLLTKGIENRQNLIVDGTGKNAKKHADKIKDLRAKGYHVKLLYAHTEMEEAVKRAAGRADESGRYVPIPILEDAHTKIPGNFEYVARHADEFMLFRAEYPAPTALWGGGRGQADVIHDAKEVSTFKKLGKRLHKQSGITLPPIPMELRPSESKSTFADESAAAGRWLDAKGLKKEARALWSDMEGPYGQDSWAEAKVEIARKKGWKMKEQAAAKSLAALMFWTDLRKSQKPPSLSTEEMLKRIRENAKHYHPDTTEENYSEGGEDLLREHASKTQTLHKSQSQKPAFYVPVEPSVDLEW